MQFIAVSVRLDDDTAFVAHRYEGEQHTASVSLGTRTGTIPYVAIHGGTGAIASDLDALERLFNDGLAEIRRARQNGGAQ